MQRRSNGPLVGWAIASSPFPMAPGHGWRLHMSKIAAKTLPVRAPLSKRRG
jgi:hypothetical protein